MTSTVKVSVPVDQWVAVDTEEGAKAVGLQLSGSGGAVAVYVSTEAPDLDTADYVVLSKQGDRSISFDLRAGEQVWVKSIAGVPSLVAQYDPVNSQEETDGISGTPLPAGTDRSGSITIGGTAQQLAAANASRRGLKGQNLSSTDLWINEIGGTAAADTSGSWRIPANATYSVSTNRAVSIVGATIGQKFTATEF